MLISAAPSSAREDEAQAEPPVAESGSPPEPERAAEEAEIAAELEKIRAAQPPAAAPPAPPPPPAPSGSNASARGLSNLMNPAISAAGVVLGGYSTRKDAGENLASGIHLQEVELRASAVVDPYFRADVTLAGNTEEIGFEEAYVSTLEIPRVTLRAGQMKANLGRHNLLHTHAFPFLTAPLPWRALIGDEGWADPGVSADVLLPLPIYAELNAQAFAGEWAAFEGDEDVDRRRDRDLAYVAHLKLLFGLGDATTLELGTSYAGGRNGFGGITHVLAGDLTLKWKPIEAARYVGFEWTTEYVWIERGDAPVDTRTRGGGYTSLRYQFAQRFWVQARGALLGLPAGDEPQTVRGETLLAFVPSEFSALRLQYALEHEADSDTLVHEVFAQLVFSIGPHPAHTY